MEVGSFRLSEGTFVERGMMLVDQLQAFVLAHPQITAAGIEVPLSGTGNRTEVTVDGMGNKSFKVRPAGGNDARILLWSLNAAANTVFRLHRIPVRQIGVKEWRKDIFGNGNIAGDESKRRAKAELLSWGVDVKNQDEAEAGMMLAWMNRRLDYLRLELKTARAGGGTSGIWNFPTAA